MSRKQQLQRWDACEEGRKAVAALMRVGGDPLSSAAAAKRLNIRRETLHRRIARRAIVWHTDDEGRYQFPRWQFGPDGMRPGVVACLRILDTDDTRAVLRFFLAPSEQANNKTPLWLLRKGHIAQAKQIAQYAPSASKA